MIVAVALAGLAAPVRPSAAATLPQLGGMAALKGWFNTFNGRPRLILLLSPT